MKKSLLITLGLGAAALALGAAAIAPQIAQAQAGVGATTSAVYELGPGGRHGGGPRGLISAAEKVTGLSRDEIFTQLQAGQSLSQIVTAAGATDAEVIAAARTALEERLAQAVTDERLTQEQADQKLADFDTNAPTWMSSTDTQWFDRGGRGGGFGHGGPRGHGGSGSLIAAAETVTGLSRDEIRTDLQAGQTLSQIVTEAGATDAEVIAAARTALEERLTQAVTDERLTQEQADQRLADFEANAPTWMTSTDLGGGPCPAP